MNRSAFIRALGALVASAPSFCHAQALDVPYWGEWKKIPSIVVVSAKDDGRLPAVHAAVSFWNAELLDLGSPFRLGTVTHIAGMIPFAEVRPTSERDGARLQFRWRNGSYHLVPESVSRLRGDIVVALSDGKIRSYTIASLEPRKVLVAITNDITEPLVRPNAAWKITPQNLVAHELGHAIGLGHNDVMYTLMCGRTIWCQAPFPGNPFPPKGFFRLTEGDKAKLLEMYPAHWRNGPAAQVERGPAAGRLER